MPEHNYTESSLIEQPAIEIFQGLGYEHLNCYNETFGSGGTLGRDNTGEVVLIQRLRSALSRLNPDAADEVGRVKSFIVTVCTNEA